MSFEKLEPLVDWFVAQAGTLYPEEVEALYYGSETQITVLLDDGTPLCAAMVGRFEDDGLLQLASVLFNRIVVGIALKRMRRLRDDVPKS